MLLINDLPGVFARAVLSPSPEVFGGAELTVQFSQGRASGGLSVNNYGGELMGPMRYLADIEGVNLLGLHDRTQARYVVSPHRELRYVALLHELPLGTAGGKLALSASEVKSIPEEIAFIPLEIETRSTSLAMTYTHPLMRTRSENLLVRGTLGAHDSETELLGFTDAKDRLRVARVGLAYDLADRWDGISLLDLEFSQGLKGLGASDNDDLALSRPEGKVDFSKATLYAARVQNLAANWSVLAAASGQYAFDNLLAFELFSFGGEAFGRGYDPSELVGDHGLALKLELRYAGDLDLGVPTSYTAYGFYDVGQVWQREVDGYSDRESAASAGLGVRFGVGPYLSGFVEFAQPLTRDVIVEENRHSRWFLGLTARF
jgi:hemolysin activation/secretion protein